MNKKETFQKLFTESGWLKKDWVQKLGISYPQLQKWLSPAKVNIRPSNIVKAASLLGYGVEWLDEENQNLKLYKTGKIGVCSEIMPFGPKAMKQAKKLKRKYVTITVEDPAFHKNDDLDISTKFLHPTQAHQQEIVEFDSHTRRIPELKEELGITTALQDGEEQSYRLIMEDDSMTPILKPGMLFIANPAIKCYSGDLAVVKLSNGQVIIGEILYVKEKIILIRHNNPNIIIELANIIYIHKITWIRVL